MTVSETSTTLRDFSLFSQIELWNARNIFTNTRRSLIKISREIEDGVLTRRIAARIFAGFQKMSFFLPHVERYTRLAENAESIWVFGIVDVDVPPIRNVSIVPLEPTDRLAMEWFLVAEAPEYYSALIAQDLSGFEVENEKRLFKGVWTFDADLVNRLQQSLSQAIGIPPLACDLAAYDYDAQIGRIANDLIGDLEKRNQELEQSQSLRNDLVSMIVHDLRNPLAVINGYLELIERVTKQGYKVEEILALVGKAQEGTQELGRLVDDILDLNRMNANEFPLERERFSVLELFEELIREYIVIAQQRRLAINMELDDPTLMIYGDRSVTKRILINLLGNAFRHTPKGGVTLEAVPCGDGVRLGVLDTGEGIPAGALPHIFDLYYQVRGKQRRRGASGLGLAFCKKAVEAQGGELWVESEIGRGSRFYFRLPNSAG